MNHTDNEINYKRVKKIKDVRDAREISDESKENKKSNKKREDELFERELDNNNKLLKEKKEKIKISSDSTSNSYNTTYSLCKIFI